LALVRERAWVSEVVEAKTDCRKEVISSTKTTIDNDIASHDIAVVDKPLIRRHQNQRTIRAELTVRFPPFQLYEFPVIRTYRGRYHWSGGHDLRDGAAEPAARRR
jgi:hypothetical protein